ncbi:uncharacterized protein UTRI_02744_B [Ustilago trichophora]|uniref:Peptidase C15, pyroglutamyl peptidase I-like protein n=1 Tax=Ustilago trichophora TaxID=86804 RepID=A0A5C3E6M4_9BASI|nr:uncharacterized protein UTRI_02744_B [Ustilago trichophora]
MAPTSRTRQLNILITGFGPFMTIEDNPSWSAVKPLHDTLLDLSSPPSLSPSSTSSSSTLAGERGPRARIQTLQLPVHYGSILDIIPRIHGSSPTSSSAQFWYDSRLDPEFGGQAGKLYPEGYPKISHPQQEEAKWDVVIHVGVGKEGSLRCEAQAHKLSYGKPDASGNFAPLLTHLTPPQLGSIEAKYLDKDLRARGFGSNGDGYEEFADVERTQVDVEQLVRWLKERGMEESEVEESRDPGRYLCDFIYYCSQCEAKRSKAGQEDEPARVIFIHVPPQGKDLSVERCTQAIRAVAWFMARDKAHVAL